jgi:S1-C subfamily serine protease
MKLLVCVALVLLTPNCWTQDKTVSVRTIADISRSIVPVVCGYQDENNSFKIAFIAGSGFFVDTSGRFLTDDHVLEGWEGAIKNTHACVPAIYIPDQGWGKFAKAFKVESFNFVNCARDATVDLAVCDLIENPFASKRLPKEIVAAVSFDATEWQSGTPVAFAGFPLSYTFPVTSIGYIAGLKEPDTVDIGFDYIIDKSTWPGVSGSPIFIPNGRVIGIIQKRGKDEGSGLAYGRSATIILDFLSKHPSTIKQEAPKKE